MTNRDRLLNISLYDLLSEINDGYDRYLCIVEKLEADPHYDEEKFRCQNTATKKQCSECIQRYLNKEVHTYDTGTQAQER